MVSAQNPKCLLSSKDTNVYRKQNYITRHCFDSSSVRNQGIKRTSVFFFGLRLQNLSKGLLAVCLLGGKQPLFSLLSVFSGFFFTRH